MANTNLIKSKIHPYVRDWLKNQYGVEFGKNALPLRDCDGKHEFDAVSSDGKIVAEIKTASGRKGSFASVTQRLPLQRASALRAALG